MKQKNLKNRKTGRLAVQTYNKLMDYFQDQAYEVEITNAQNTCVNNAINKSEKALKKGIIMMQNLLCQLQKE